MASRPGPQLAVGHDLAPQVLCWKRSLAQPLVPSSALSPCRQPKLWHVRASSLSASNHDEHEEKSPRRRKSLQDARCLGTTLFGTHTSRGPSSGGHMAYAARFEAGAGMCSLLSLMLGFEARTPPPSSLLPCSSQHAGPQGAPPGVTSLLGGALLFLLPPICLAVSVLKMCSSIHPPMCLLQTYTGMCCCYRCRSEATETHPASLTLQKIFLHRSQETLNHEA